MSDKDWAALLTVHWTNMQPSDVLALTVEGKRARAREARLEEALLTMRQTLAPFQHRTSVARGRRVLWAEEDAFMGAWDKATAALETE